MRIGVDAATPHPDRSTLIVARRAKHAAHGFGRKPARKQEARLARAVGG